MKILNPGEPQRDPTWFVGFIIRCRDCRWVFQLEAEDAATMLYCSSEAPFGTCVICPGCKSMISIGQSPQQVKDSDRTRRQHP